MRGISPVSGARALMVAALIGVGAGAGFAQTAPAEGLDASAKWLKICSQPGEGAETLCVVARERRATNGQPIAAVQIREQADKKILVLAVPPAMLLRPGVQIKIDQSEPVRAAYSICYPNFCFAEAAIKDDYVASMKRGNTIALTSLNQQAKPVTIEISLSGFTAAYDGEPLDPEEIKAAQQQLQEELKKRAEDTRRQLIEKQNQQQTQ